MSDNDNDDKAKPTLIPGTEWAAIPVGGAHESDMDKERIQVMQDAITNILAIKGKEYMTIILISLNSFNTQHSMMNSLGRIETQEQLSWVARIQQQTFESNAILLISLIYKDKTISEMRDMVLSLTKDFMTLADMAAATFKQP